MVDIVASLWFLEQGRVPFDKLSDLLLVLDFLWACCRNHVVHLFNLSSLLYMRY